eukprot:scaffold173028_cov48-Attheya_sp.AAC.2
MDSLWSLFSSHEADEDQNVLHRQVTPFLSPSPPAKRARLSGEEGAFQQGGFVNNPLLLPHVNNFRHPISIDREVEHVVKGIRLENRKRSNAVHAKKSRERNKQFVASLELESQALQKENDCLKALVKKSLPDRAQSIIGECCYKPRGKGFPQGTQTSRLAHIVGSDFDLIESLTSGGHSFVLTDPRLPDNPIVYASSAFFSMTGYTRDTVVGRNCRFLQGIDTKNEAVNTIREAIKSGTDGAACLLNYKADGTPFWNNFFIAALRDRDHRIVNYVGVQSEVDKSTSKDDTSLDFMNSKPALPNHFQKVEKVIPVFSANLKPGANDPENITVCPIEADDTVSLADAQISVVGAEGEDDDDDIDWADLAEVLEAEYQDGCEDGESTTNWMHEDIESSFLNQEEEPNTDPNDENILSQFFQSPRELVTKTVRSELIDSLLESRGDVTDPRFLSALN